MPYDMESINSGPKGVQVITKAGAIPGSRDNEEMLNFLRRMSKLRAQPQNQGLGAMMRSGGPSRIESNHGGGPADQFAAQMRALQLEQAMGEGGVWRKNGVFGEQNVSPGTIGAYRVQSAY